MMAVMMMVVLEVFAAAHGKVAGGGCEFGHF